MQLIYRFRQAQKRSWHFFPVRLFNKTKAPTMDKVRGNSGARTERNPIIIQNDSSNPSSRENLDLRPYDRPHKVLLLTCVVNCSTGTLTPRLCPVVQWSVHWAPSRTTRVLVLAVARRCALRTCGEKMQAPLLGLAKSIYYHSQHRRVFSFSRVSHFLRPSSALGLFTSGFFYLFLSVLCEGFLAFAVTHPIFWAWVGPLERGFWGFLLPPFFFPVYSVPGFPGFAGVCLFCLSYLRLYLVAPPIPWCTLRRQLSLERGHMCSRCLKRWWILQVVCRSVRSQGSYSAHVYGPC